MSSGVLMKCGCAAQGTCSSMHGVTYNPPVPSCIVHDCIERAESPNLEGRLAQCYCGNTRPSSLDLPFFEYLGVGSPEVTRKCKCGYYEQAHWPRWNASIRVIRRWFKIERDDSVTIKAFHAPESMKEVGAENEANFFRGKQQHDTEVFSAEVVAIHPARNELKCKAFTPIGPQERDKYYCGCNGWD